MEENLMKAQVEVKPGVWEFRDVMVPVPGEGELLLRLRVCAVGVGEMSHGHGFFGTVEELGPGVSCFEVGDRAAACKLRGDCFADYVCVSETDCCRLSEELDDYTSAFVAPLAFALRTVRVSDVPLAKPCIVHGTHLLRTAIASARGLAPVIAVVGNESERAAVLKIGADYAIDAERTQNIDLEIARILDGREAALVVEGDLVAQHPGGPWAWEDAVTLLTYRRIDPKPLYSVAVPLEDLQNVLEELNGPDGPVIVFIDTSLQSRFTFPAYREPVSATIKP